jgi:HSP20 family protein
MKDTLTHTKECTVYPGGYSPLPEKEALFEKLNLHHKDSAVKPLLNLDEFNDYYKVEIMVPGAKREDIFIYIHDNFLSIAVLHKMCGKLKKDKLQIHEYDTKCLERHILLPENTDTEFISAEYRQGILQLHLPKTKEPSKTANKQIVVY